MKISRDENLRFRGRVQKTAKLKCREKSIFFTQNNKLE